ncbi:hypothetical protein RJ640_016814 [Escallonia rubra]|uniref:AP2/ERF domain-containing protein n=1 Tax=Escallonia rubra TaxID=112253 RepID=A0AA88RBB2_9ASTE|nr:hypothetical protein RJ640_016814 [Escallonia rubra]
MASLLLGAPPMASLFLNLSPRLSSSTSQTLGQSLSSSSSSYPSLSLSSLSPPSFPSEMVVFDTISLKIHHGGYFTGGPNMEWKGRVVDVLDGMDVNIMSYWELVGIIGDLGLPSSSLMYYQVPGLDFRLGLRPITDDYGVMSMLEYYKSTYMVYLYVERVDQIQVVGSDGNVIVEDRLLIENNNGEQDEMKVEDGDVTDADDTGGGSGKDVHVGDDVKDGLRDVHLGCVWTLDIGFELKKKSRIWLGTFPRPEMAARAHDVAALSIKGNSAILNFPELAGSLPRPLSVSPRDVQVAAAKAAAMDKFDPQTTSPSTSLSSSSSLSSLVSANSDLSNQDELGEIVELPSLGTCFDSLELRSDFVYVDSVDGWCYPPSPWSSDGGYFSDQMPLVPPLESLLWNY